MGRIAIPENWRDQVAEALREGRVTVATPQKPNRRGRKPDPVVAIRRGAIAKAHAEGASIAAMAERFNVSDITIRNDLERLSLKPNPGKRVMGSFDKAAKTRVDRAEAGVARVKGRRRFKTVPVPMGSPGVFAPEGQTGTMFPTRVFPVGSEDVLKDGSSNSKIGGDVLKGALKGARIFTLTLEERATCPRSCLIWSGCYGNAMQYSRRWKQGAELEAKIAAEVAQRCAEHEKILVRLHILGDFYSLEYLWLWQALLDIHPGLHVFGFTAHPTTSPIGMQIDGMRKLMPRRWAVRTSGTSGPWGSFTLDFPTEKTRIGDAVVCPEQAEAMRGQNGRHCGNCALCWQSDTPIAFVEH